MKDEKDKKPEECPVDLTPVEEAQAAALESGGGGNTNPPKPGGK